MLGVPVVTFSCVPFSCLSGTIVGGQPRWLTSCLSSGLDLSCDCCQPGYHALQGQLPASNSHKCMVCRLLTCCYAWYLLSEHRPAPPHFDSTLFVIWQVEAAAVQFQSELDSW